MYRHNHEFNQNGFLDVKDISLNHRYDSLKWYESIHTHGFEVVCISPSPNLSKSNPMRYGWKIKFLSDEMVSKRLYMIKLVAKILN